MSPASLVICASFLQIDLAACWWMFSFCKCSRRTLICAFPYLSKVVRHKWERDVFTNPICWLHVAISLLISARQLMTSSLALQLLWYKSIHIFFTSTEGPSLPPVLKKLHTGASNAITSFLESLCGGSCGPYNGMLLYASRAVWIFFMALYICWHNLDDVFCPPIFNHNKMSH